jgi:hypothetical protein
LLAEQAAFLGELRAARPVRSQLKITHSKLQRSLAVFSDAKNEVATMEALLVAKKQALEVARLATLQLQQTVRSLTEAVRSEEAQQIAGFGPWGPSRDRPLRPWAIRIRCTAGQRCFLAHAPPQENPGIQNVPSCCLFVICFLYNKKKCLKKTPTDGGAWGPGAPAVGKSAWHISADLLPN